MDDIVCIVVNNVMYQVGFLGLEIIEHRITRVNGNIGGKRRKTGRTISSKLIAGIACVIL